MNRFAICMRRKFAVVGGIALAASQSQAAGVNLTDLTAGVDLSTVTPAILAVAVILLGPRIAKYAVVTVLRFFPK